ncbi:hypothetical protein LMG28138_01159 [Pararobbsia alpina]|uniref:Resolvase HTH domain-containing protein n=2 Tax=Pararobbsia alpina TaxID=621374 RepID=A0A6S7AYF9_9BURK|nr:hypothetical protein LMG28138_01159 [Pararobbsia alpina]
MTRSIDSNGCWIGDAMHAMLNDLLIEIAAAKAREEYELRRDRAAQGVDRRKARDAAGETDSKGYAGRKADADMHVRIVELRTAGFSYSKIAATLKTTRPTIARALRAAGMLEGGKAEAGPVDGATAGLV